MKKYIYLFVAIVFIAVTTGVVYASHSWGDYHWARTTTSFNLKLGDNVPSVWDSYLTTASLKWNLSTVLDTQIINGASKKNCGAILGQVEICASRYGRNGWLGVASIWTSGDHIVQGTVKLNDTYFNTQAYNKPEWRQMVLCQEVGHTFGLDHQDEDFSNINLGTCMDYTNDPARDDGFGNNVNPNSHDYSMLETIYAHLETVATSQKNTSSFKGKVVFEDEFGNDQKNWGKEIKRSADGHSSLFEKDLGSGQKVFRHVFWAEARVGTHQE